ncbi:ABC transporter ATP-binding protein [Mycoplasmopsis felis]|uniref:ABC transporter ATP-binding protein n=1 Tax=Mycoplasmopsis felis TaxID=33923 RepID=UPI002B003A50|nr:ABC transporter ATP-binding protein [Mycoplasmopsis felis]WQQ11156.1 ABC transporter ATP-binding protein [Mycoplasmopsis felis]
MRYRRDIYSLKTSKISNKDRFSTFSKIINLLWKDYKYKLLFSVFLIIISTGGMLYNQVFIGKIIVDNFLSDYKNKPFDYENFYLVVTLSALWFFITVLAGFFWKRILIKVTIKTLTKLRTNLYIHIQSLPIAFFDNNKKGDLMSRFTSDIETLRDFISNSLPRIMDTIITLSVSVVVMFILNWLLSLIMIIMMVVILLFSYFIGQQSKKAFVLRQKNNGILSGFTEEAISSIKTIKIFTQEKNMINKYQKLSNELYKNELKARGLADLLFPFSIWMGEIGYLTVTVFGAILIIQGNYAGIGLTIGTLIAFTQFAKSFSGPVSSILEVANSIIIALAGGKRVFDILQNEKEVNNGSIECVKVKEIEGKITEIQSINEEDWYWAYKFVDFTGKIISYKKVEGNIEFKNVSFSYKDKQTLSNINFKLKQGQKLALVGPTGSGKTTIINLLVGFYEINEGSIYIDDIEIRTLNKNSLRQIITIILQDASLFSDTVKNNIIYGSTELVNDNLYKNAIELSNLKNHINKLEKKEETFLSDKGNHLSQGQKQLLTIARATYKNSPILILDEATSNIDTITEFEIQKSMDYMVQNKTTILIAHRLSTIKNADIILVISNGKIIETGNHNDLLALKGFYYELWNNSIKITQFN